MSDETTITRATTVSLPGRVVALLRAEAERQDRSLAQLVELAIRRALPEWQARIPSTPPVCPKRRA